MGCDGGSIPQRPEMVKTKKEPERKDPSILAKARWLTCCISGMPLSPPIVADELGNLFNKDEILKRLLEKSLPEKLEHIHKIKDLITLNFERNPAYDYDLEEVAKTKPIDEVAPLFICPFTQEEANGHHRFITLLRCGHVMAESALKQFRDPVCPACQHPYAPDEVIVLNGTEEDQALAKRRVIQRRTQQLTNRGNKRPRTSEREDSGIAASSSSSRASSSSAASTATPTPAPPTATATSMAALPRPTTTTLPSIAAGPSRKHLRASEVATARATIASVPVGLTTR